MNHRSEQTRVQRVDQRLTVARLSAGIAIAIALLQAPVHAQDAAPAGTQAQTAKPDTQKKKTEAQKKAEANKQVDPTATELGGITVTGVRASLQSAASIKQNADQIVDSIVAEDIGKLPDSNVAEALQRISGIQIDRNYGEGSSIAIRGLTQVRTELNGRDSFTANGGRALSFEDVPSELLAGIDVYKNPSAEIIEGGLGGTVNLRTHKPFDFEGRKLAVTGEYDYGDLISKGNPSASGLFSNRWNTDIGEFGVLLDVAYQKHAFRQDVVSTEPFYQVNEGSGGPDTIYPGYAGRTLNVPHGGGVGETYGDRKRLGTALALQWRPNAESELYLQALRSDYKFQWKDYAVFGYSSANGMVPQPGAPFQFGPNGDFQSGTFSGTTDAGSGAYSAGIPVDSNSSLATRHSKTTDISWGGSWNATNSLTLSTDFQYIKATTDQLRYILNTHTTAPSMFQDISGGIPVITVPQGSLTDPSTQQMGFALDDRDKSKGREFAWRADAEYTFDSNFLQSMKFGVRTTDRKADTQTTGYRFSYLGKDLSTLPSSMWIVNSFNDFFRGNANTFGETIAPNPALLSDYPGSLTALGITAPLTYNPFLANHQNEKTYAAYGVLRFGWRMWDIPVDGNIGMRGVRTKVGTSGFMSDPNGSGTYTPLSVNSTYNSYLPSLNLNIHLTDKLQWRFAASKALTRPNFDQLNPTLSLSTPNASGANTFTGSAGNPNLQPMKARQYDTSLEWYYNPTSMLYGALFYKSVDGFIANGVFNETYNGQVYQVTRPTNGDNGIIKGAETGYQTFFDFLPEPFNGLGVQANYTYVYSKAPSPSATDTSGRPLQVPLEGLSKNSYNFILMYEKGPVSARVAYNWRSQWVETTAGNGTGNLPIYDKAFGQVDASVTYHVTDAFSLTGAAVNLTNTKRSTIFGLDSRPRDVQINDRLFSLKAQFTF
ncbi:TonB-dependent receptor [Luteibacter rhizovicinus]|uniref:TonB-dependent receptor n=1 Tax=Luteibacter rhizovicinus TaxID=242606 RepID=A0A4R3YU16_9GAMM|nr:TonB-dependent receptor [Luteibacter rhizovicinus]TCV95932.1 TonB-dependent receptor [Luteibacter rhizovicinus]